MNEPDHLTISRLRGLIRDIPDFPQEGVMFRDITPLLRDPAGLSMAMEFLAQPFMGLHVDAVVGVESRGFIFAMAMATKLSAGFIPVRKPGRLPASTRSESYTLEYGSNQLEIHDDAVRPGDNVLLVDDLLATGGTMAACCRLIEGLGGQVLGTAFLIELEYLKGRDKLGNYPVYSVLKYE